MCPSRGAPLCQSALPPPHSLNAQRVRARADRSDPRAVSRDLPLRRAILFPVRAHPHRRVDEPAVVKRMHESVASARCVSLSSLTGDAESSALQSECEVTMFRAR